MLLVGLLKEAGQARAGASVEHAMRLLLHRRDMELAVEGYEEEGLLELRVASVLEQHSFICSDSGRWDAYRLVRRRPNSCCQHRYTVLGGTGTPAYLIVGRRMQSARQWLEST